MKNRALIALVTVVVAVFGGLALTSLKQELAPSIQFPQLAVMTQYPGAAPEVVNDDVSAPIETAIQGVPNIESTSATSSTNLSLVTAKFVYGTDLATAEQKINQAINRIKSGLPEGLDPQVLSGSIDDLPVIQLAVTQSGRSDADTSGLADRIRHSVLGDLTKVDGVRDAQLLGAPGQRITITPDAAKLAALGLTTQSIKNAFAQAGVLLPAGSITEDGKTLAVQAGSKLGSVDDIAALPLTDARNAAALSSAPVTIGDVASVALAEEPKTSISRVNGDLALTIAVTKLPAANTVEVSQGVRDILPHLEDTLGEGATFTIVFDQAPYIEQSIAALTQEGLLGLLFAVIVILVFLLSVRSTLITAISIPTSVLITFIVMQGVDYTLNIITLGALTIAIGRVVDDSIVVTENIKRHLEGMTDAGGVSPTGGTGVGAGVAATVRKDRRSELQRAPVIIEAVREVAGAITASTATTVAVFLPIAFVGDMTGELFRPFALTITIALAASLLVALTIVPVLAYWFLRTGRIHKHARTTPVVSQNSQVPLSGEFPPIEIAAEGGNPQLNGEDGAGATEVEEHPTRLQRGYLPVIHWTLRHGIVTIILAALVLGGTIALVPLMKTNFLGSSGQNTFRVTQSLDASASLAVQDEQAKKVEEILRDTKGVETVQLTIGSSGSALRDAFTGGGAGTVTFSVTTDESADQDALIERVRSRLDRVTDGGEIAVAASSGFGASNDIEVDVTAADRATLQKASDAVLAAVGKLDSVSQAESNLAVSRPYIAVVIDRTAAGRAGLSELALGSLVSQAMQPTTIGTIVIDETTEKVYVSSQNAPQTIAELRSLPVPTRAGVVPLDSLASVEQVDGPATITSVRGLRSATVMATPASDDLGTASADVQAAIDELTLPGGASATIGGVTASQSDAFQQLGLALLAAILIVYVIMVATFRSLLQPLLLLVSVPFAATGAILLQLATGIPLGVPSLVGVLMLIGIVVTNAIVLIDLVNQYRRRGMSVREALVLGSSRRLRPILMTALATIFALVPMALGLTGHGGFISQPLALVVIGGLVSSTFLTLVVLPVLYSLVEGTRERRALRRATAS